MIYTILILWLLFLIGAVFYTRRARHPDARPLAAYLIFVTVFTVCAFVLYGLLLMLLQLVGWIVSLSDPVSAVLFLAVIFLPAFFIARWQVRKPPIVRNP